MSDLKFHIIEGLPKSVSPSAVVRNRVKRQLRASWEELTAAESHAGRDYVLVARPGLAEPSETRGHAWLVEQVAELLGKAAAA